MPPVDVLNPNTVVRVADITDQKQRAAAGVPLDRISTLSLDTVAPNPLRRSAK